MSQNDKPQVGDLIYQDASPRRIIGLVVEIRRLETSTGYTDIVCYYDLLKKRQHGIHWRTYSGKYWHVMKEIDAEE